MSNRAIGAFHIPGVLHPPFCVLLNSIVLLLASASAAQADTAITATTGAGNLGTHLSEPVGHIYGITHGTTVGNNVFHSFDQFSVATGDIAQFQTSNLIPNAAVGTILGRVTGGNPSAIFGTIDSATYYPSANLFLMNPHGFLFGPNAAVNIGGMAHFTTADYLKLADGNVFTAVPDMTADAMLTTVPVAAFGFLGSNPAAIAVQCSHFTVTNGTGLSLIGGNHGFIYNDPDTGLHGSVSDGVTISGGTLVATNGVINLVSVASPGEILLPGLGFAPNIHGNSFTSVGSVIVSDGSLLDASGSPGGTVRIRSGQFVLDSSLLIANTTGDIDGASTAVDIQTLGDATVRNASAIVSYSDGAGRSGDIEINARNVRLSDGSAIFSGSFGSAPASNILITATDSVSLTGTDPFGSGAGSTITSDSLDFCGCAQPSGNINVTASLLTLDDQAIIQTRAFGDRPGGNITLDLDNVIVTGGSAVRTEGGEFSPSGNITITADRTILLSGQFDSDTPSRILNVNEGLAGTGTITLETGSLFLQDGARIQNTSLASPETGQDPKITIAAHDTVNLSGDSTIRVVNVASTVGGIDISGDRITLTDQSAIGTTTYGDGNAGPIHITASNLSVLSGSTVESSTFFNAGLGGNIAISLTGSLVLNGQARSESGDVISSNISSRTTGSGDGGHITISAHSTEISGGALINTSSALGMGHAGSVTIQGPAASAQSVFISDSGSGIFTETTGRGTGGNILIDANNITLQNGGRLSAKTSGTEATATGGSITVTATNQVTMIDGASISASSTGLGHAGSIQIDAGNQFTMTNSTVTTEATQSGGGAIKVTTDPDGTVQLTDSMISASVLEGTGGGGSVNIDPLFVILVNSHILATAVQGAGGNIFISTNLLLPDANSVISASSQFGQQGTVTIQSQYAPVGGQIHPLGKTPLLAASLFTQQCASVAGGQFSSFTVAGRDRLPTEPGSWLTSSLYGIGIGEGHGVRGNGLEDMSAHTGRVARDQRQVGDRQILSLRQIAPAGFLTQAFAVDRTAGCAS